MSECEPVALLRADQCQCWREGNRTPVEDYLERHPGLRGDTEAILDLILNEVILREEAGDLPRLAEYVGRFPTLGDDLRTLFEVHQALEPGDPAATTPTLDADAQIAAVAGWTATVPLPTRRPSGAGSPSGVAVPGYEIEAELGRGGMGVVYRARHLDLKRPVALKMILAGAYADPSELLRFRIEAEAVACLQHPHVVQIHEIGEQGGCPYLCLEFVDGGSLDTKLAGTPLPAREAARLAETLARAVHHVHRHGILHRDLKPANVLLTAEGVPKITDFGLAKLLDSDPGRTPTDAFLGTPSYMAPEQAEGRTRAIDVRSDVYALGAVLYELLTGRPPFRAATVLDTMKQVITEEPVAPSRLQPKIPRDLETICLKCLEKAPAQRYGSAEALADDLVRFLAGESIRARPIGPGQRALAAQVAVSVAAALALASLAFWLDASGRRRVSEKRAAWRDADLRARAALAGGDWQGAKVHLARALAAIGREPALADEATQAGRLFAQVDTKLAARDRFARFERGRDEVLFRATQALDADSDEVRGTAVAAARDALASIGLRYEDESGPISLDPAYDAGQRDAIASGGYELLVVLADALARPLSGESLRLLDRAATLSRPTRAYHLRCARCLAALGDEAAARREQERAKDVPADEVRDAFLAGVDRFMGGKVRAGGRVWWRRLAASSRPSGGSRTISGPGTISPSVRSTPRIPTWRRRTSPHASLGVPTSSGSPCSGVSPRFSSGSSTRPRPTSVRPGSSPRTMTPATRSSSTGPPSASNRASRRRLRPISGKPSPSSPTATVPT